MTPLINITSKQAWCFSGFLVLYQFLTYIANDMIMPGMIHVVHSFHGSETDVATSLTAYVLGGASLQLFLGPISDYIGRRPVMLFGALLFLVCTLYIAYSGSMQQFLLARFFQGMGLCFTGVVGYATLQEIFAEMDAIRLVGMLTNLAAFAPLLGPLAGATFILYFNWRIIFLVIGVVALLAFWGLWRFMPESINVLKKDGERIKSSPLTPTKIWQNYKQLLSNPTFMMGACAEGLINIPCIAWIALSPVIIVHDAHLSVMQYALWQLPVFSIGIIGNIYLRKLTKYHSINQLIFKGSSIAGMGLLLAWLLPLSIHHGFAWLIPGLVIYCFGMSLTVAPIIRLTLYTTSVSKGTAYAMISMVSMIIQALGIELANKIYASHNIVYFGGFCVVMGLLYLISIAGILTLTKTYKKPVPVMPLT
ncbi:MAG: multidrug transporter MdfA [Legionellaceae bacterium]|nr:multidrug transporter MdfA [Legionellaceae bacterium]HCA89377.1 multidrug transporter MdfA [Legionellales bacterium]|tara:strand:- start:761 stop:2023 length:1263 start_codon:yes stop_codon:yes gene_type:complete